MKLTFDYIYDLGKNFKIIPNVKSMDEKFELINYEYTSSEVLSGIFIVLIVSLFLSLIFFLIPLISYIFLFFGLVIAIGAFLWANSINYSQSVLKFREEMLQALLEIVSYVSLNTSIESAIEQTAPNLTGVLGKQFRDILSKIRTKKHSDIGSAFEEYIPIWLKINPDFVKGINLIQTAAIAPESERENILNEVIETVILSYYDSGKRLTEKLSNNTKALISIGVMIPMMSLIMLPLITIFLPGVANASLLFFIYVIFFPTLLLFLSMNFATNRVQVNTINFESSPLFKKMPAIMYLIPFAIAIIFFIVPVIHLMTIDLTTTAGVAREYSLESIFIIWTGLLGIVIGVELFCYVYQKLNERLWLEMDEIERDIPNLLQIFSSYLSLNRSMESIFQDVIQDYKRHGFGSHPSVKIIEKIKLSLYNTKKSLKEISVTIMPAIIPSVRLNSILRRIINFTEIDSKSAAKSAKMIRSQTLSIYKLDDYIQTLLSETISIVSLSVTMLAPLLATAATIMAAAIVMSLEFIKQKINQVVTSVGGEALELQFVNIQQIIPPTTLELIVGLFFIELTIILSIFLSTIRHGSDKYKIAKTVQESLLIAFLIYTLLLFGGYYVFTEMIFKGVLAG